MITVGILALQGDFLEHEAVLSRLGVNAIQVRKSENLHDLDGFIVPGGESTTVCRLMQEYQLYKPLRRVLSSGLPTWGTCAGMIVLAQHVDSLEYPTLETLDITVERNGYGRQVNSFESDIPIPILGELPFHAIFIRAPVVRKVGADVEILATLSTTNGGGGSPVALRQGNLLATTFHPELTEDSRLHRYFLGMVESAERRSNPR